MELDEIDRRIINAMQSGFPVESQPFAAVADQLGLTEKELIARLSALTAGGIITRFGPFLDAAAMGGAFCLCAMEIPQKRFNAIAEIVNNFDQVAHNYARDHRLNMWFVLATDTPEEISRSAAQIETATGLPVYQFPKLKEFFVGFRVAA